MYKHQNERAWYNGTLDPDQERRLRDHGQFLVENLQCDQLLDIEVTKDLFNVYDRHTLKHATDRVDTNAKLVNIMLGKTAQGFQVFLQALLQTGQDEVYGKLCVSKAEEINTGEGAVQTEETNEEAAAAAAAGTSLEEQSEEEEKRSKELDAAKSSSSSEGLPTSVTLTSLADEQNEQRQRMTGIEQRVDTLTNSVDHLTTEFRHYTRTVQETDRQRHAQMEELQNSLHTREALLMSASEQIKDLRAKIEEIEREKCQGLDQAHSTIERMSQEIEQMSREKQRLEERVEQLTSDNQQLRDAIERINEEKEEVMTQLQSQARELQAVKAGNRSLEHKLSKNEQTMNLFVSKVENLELRVESAKPARKLRSVARRGRKSSVNCSSNVPEESPAPQKTPEDQAERRVLQPRKQSVAKPNSKKL